MNLASCGKTRTNTLSSHKSYAWLYHHTIHVLAIGNECNERRSVKIIEEFESANRLKELMVISNEKKTANDQTLHLPCQNESIHLEKVH